VSASQLLITTALEVDQIVITASVVSGGFLPPNIFLYKNTGATTLGAYWGVANTDELTRFQVWNGVAIPAFGNAFVRSNQAKIFLSVQGDVQDTIAHITKTAQTLSTALQTASSTTQTVNIT
jgi:hypothetical protein